ncbi:hypothetical protein SSX86_015561 [Deinandra increscens subsp. villosa]|uniref:Heat shock 70 kDa protein 16 n=1 Tax=Deinandra increscens subsp. villosa TaxID=3103831 RepID=A0AAP0CWA7_9ASTR
MTPFSESTVVNLRFVKQFNLCDFGAHQVHLLLLNFSTYVDDCCSDESKHETPAVVSFSEKKRFFGSAGAAFATANPKSTVSQIKRLIGKLYKEVEKDLKLLPFVTREGPRGGILIELEYLKTKWTFTPVEILGMLFKHLKEITEKNLGSSVVECVIGIPSYFSDLQRRLYLDAALIAGINPLTLMHDGTAIALGYGMNKTDFSKSGPTNVMFVDIGHCDTQVTLAAFEPGKMKILSHSFDQNLGGRDFDEVLFHHFAALFNAKYEIDIYTNARASTRLRASCKKVKKVLSANAEAPLIIECLIGDTNVRGFITREEFENLSAKMLERVMIPCSMALEDAGLSVDKIYTFELVGSGSRISAIKRILTLFFKKEPTRRLNASECVARGCAIRCAMLSPTLLVHDYKIEDSFPYSIVIPSPQGEYMLFPKGSPFPNEKMLTHQGNTRFYLQVTYTNKRDFPAGISNIVGRFGVRFSYLCACSCYNIAFVLTLAIVCPFITRDSCQIFLQIGSSEPSDAEKADVEFRVKLNHHGIVEIVSAIIIGDKHHISNLPISENVDVATTNDELLEAKVKEKMLAEQDIELSGSYRTSATESEKELPTNNLQKDKDLLHKDNDDESKQEYTQRLKDLQKEVRELRSQVTHLHTHIETQLENQVTHLHSHIETQLENERLVREAMQEQMKEAMQQQMAEFKRQFDAAVANAEACEVEEKEKMLAEQDIKVEETKDQRNTLLYIVYDMRRKLSDAYRSYATDSEKELITNNLQKTEDWLYEDNEDQSEQDYTGKVKDLQKLLEPIENRYNKENAIAKATKSLQSCIAQYCSYADVLPGDKKEEVKNVCREAEHWLAFSRKHFSKTLLTDINRAINGFESNCKNIIRSKHSYSRNEEHVDSKRAREKVAEPLQTCITKYNLFAESLPAEMKEEVKIVCREAEQWLVNAISPKGLSLKNLSTSVNHNIKIVESNCESIIWSESSFGRHEEPVDLDQTDRIVELDQKDHSMDSENATKALEACIAKYLSLAELLPADMKKKVKGECMRTQEWLVSQSPSSPNSNVTYINHIIEDFQSYCESIIRSKASPPRHEEPVNSDQTEQPMDMVQTEQPMESDDFGLWTEWHSLTLGP